MDLKKRREFGEWIKDKRRERGLTLQELSESLGYNSRGTIGGVEAGQMPLPIEKVFKAAELLNIPMREFLGKLQECEPELYDKYEALEQGFEKTLFQKIRSYGRAKGAESAYHHQQKGKESEGKERKQYYILSDAIKRIIDLRKRTETIVNNTQSMLVLGMEGS